MFTQQYCLEMYPWRLKVVGYHGYPWLLNLLVTQLFCLDVSMVPRNDWLPDNVYIPHIDNGSHFHVYNQVKNN